MLEIFEIQIQILILNFSAAPSIADTQIHTALQIRHLLLELLPCDRICL